MQNITVTAQQQATHIIYVCNQTKQPYANLAQLERIFPSVSSPTIRRRLEEVSKSELKTAVIRSHTRDYEVSLYPASVVLDLALEFDIALAKLMAEAGAAMYLYGLAGYRVQAVEAPKLPTAKELAYLLIAAEDEKERLQAQIDITAPATALGQLIESAVNEIRIGDFAKSIGMGQNKYFEELRSDGIICLSSTLPYQRWIDSGYFRVTQIQQQTSKGLQTYPVSLIKPKGQAWLAKRHQKHLARESAIVTIEAQVSPLV
jgi:phage antirepressor YoqD-like protein